MHYRGAAPNSDTPPCTGVLLVNLGTPDSPDTRDVRRYLKEFLSDPRVVEAPRLLWWLALNGIILRIRPRRSAAAYQQVWGENGSPLLSISQQQAGLLQERFDQAGTDSVKVVLAMRYGNPSMEQGLETLRQANARKVIVLPLYPQYSATTTASTFDKLAEVFKRWRWLPEISFISGYHDHPLYIEALKAQVESHWESQGRADCLLFSFHGIPERYRTAGDPYPQQCRETAEKLAQALGLEPSQWLCTFQSRFGKEPWVQPYTDTTLKSLPQDGVKSVQITCPGFSADCLETLEEIAEENRDYFLNAGGQRYSYIPALNTTPGHIELIARLIQEKIS